jgi:hypothetical protein
MCGNMPHIQKWLFPHNSSPSSLSSSYCTFHCAGQQLSKGIWHTQHKSKQDINTYNFTISFGAINGLKA